MLQITSIRNDLSELRKQEDAIGQDFIETSNERKKLDELADRLMTKCLACLAEPGMTEENADLLRRILLEVIEVRRSRDIALMNLRIARLGEWRRAPWPTQARECQEENFLSKIKRIKQLSDAGAPKRKCVETEFYRESPTYSYYNSFELENYLSSRKTQRVLNYQNLVSLHFGFAGNDLVMVLDTGLAKFVYEASLQEGYVLGKSFADYRFDYERVAKSGVSWMKIVPGGKGRSVELLKFSVDQKVPTDVQFWTKFNKLFFSDELMDELSRIADNKGIRLSDLCLVLFPSEHLFLLPLPFLSGSGDRLLATHVGGMCVSLSLLAFKWNVQVYHWTVKVNMDPGLRCSFFASKGAGDPLNLQQEREYLCKNFGTESFQYFGEKATRDQFHQHYTEGAVCWFAGHGQFSDTLQLSVESGHAIPFPLSGLLFSDGPLTNLELLATSNWNFRALWLLVLNCCVVGQSVIVGNNPYSFISALHNTGSISTVSCLYEIDDAAAVTFAKHFSSELVQADLEFGWPRARAFSNALRKSLEEIKDYHRLAPYCLWGIP